jgi:hypothetical protein
MEITINIEKYPQLKKMLELKSYEEVRDMEHTVLHSLINYFDISITGLFTVTFLDIPRSTHDDGYTLRIQFIKFIRTITGWGLRESKEYADELHNKGSQFYRSDMTQDEVNNIIEQFRIIFPESYKQYTQFIEVKPS